jgi:tetratricopeptide (TPR) repeat protein
MDESTANSVFENGLRERQSGDRAAALAAFEAVIAAHPEHIWAKLEAGVDLRELGRLDEAETMFRRALEAAPEHTGALMGLGQVLRQRGDRVGALAKFERVIAADPTYVWAKIDAGHALRELGRLDEAEAMFRRALEAASEHTGSLMGLGQVLRQRGDRVGALAKFERVIAVDPAHGWAKVDAGHMLRELGRLDEAEAMFRRALEAAPEHAGALMGLGQVLRQRGDRVGALAKFERVIAADPTHVWAKVDAGHALRELGRLEEAARMFRRALEAAPEHAGALMGLGQVLRQRGDRVGALANFERVIVADPTHVWAKVDAGHALRELGRLVEAETMFRRVLEAAPEHTGALMGLGQVLRQRGDRVGALAKFERVIAADPTHVWAKVDAGHALRELGRLVEAEAIFRRALIDDKDHVGAQLGLAQLLLETYRLDEAKSLFERVIGQSPTDISSRMGLGYLARRHGDRKAALNYFKSAASIDPKRVDAQMQVAAELADQGQFSNAHQILDLIESTSSDDLRVLMQRGLVNRKEGKRAEAAKIFGQVLKRWPAHIQAMVELALEQRALGAPDDSEHTLKNALDLSPNNPAILMQLAESKWLEDRFEESLQLSNMAIEAQPANFWPYLIASRAAADLGQTKVANEILDRAIASCGRHPQIIAKRIELRRLARDWADAQALIHQDSEEAGRQFSIWSQSVLLGIAIGEMAAVERALQNPPATTIAERARVKLFQGQVAEAKWDLELALRLFDEAIALSPDDSWYHFEAARVCLKLLKLNDARVHLAESIKLSQSTYILRGLSARVSQTHLGQIVDEFALDQEQLEQLREMQTLAPELRIGKLKNLVRRNPDHTPTAIMLLIALRQAGLLHSSPKLANARETIPSRIVQYWNDPKPPSEIADLMHSWQRMNPDKQYLLFDDRSALDFLRTKHSPDVARAFVRAREPAQRADIFRLAYLAGEGGFYADADDYCHANIGDFAPLGTAFITYQEDYGTLGNNFIGAASGHHVMILALRHAVEALNRGDSDLLWLSTGPGLLTRAFAEVLANEKYEIDLLRTTAFFDFGQLQRSIGFHCPARYKKTEAHWSRSAFKGELSRATSSA